MAEMLLCDKLEELRLEIDRQHLGYLQSDERRGEQRSRLETYIREFLCLASHERKFIFIQTADVLRRSATARADFSGYRAACAWAALAKYADNLVLQPWRKEFREIKLYCGFYKHEVEEHLVGAEQMFEAMGYRHVGHSTMTLHDTLDPDLITSVSKDAMMAEVECRIMQQIWDAMAQHRITWAQVLEFRESHASSPDQAVRHLTFRVRERLHKEKQQRPTCYNNYYDGHSMHYPLPPQPPIQLYQRYAHIVSPHQLPSNNYHYSHPSQVLKPQDLYPSNGYHVHPSYTPHVHHNSHNGYSHAHMAPYSHPSTVPTAQLIELETSPVHTTHHSHIFPYTLPEPVRTADFPSSKAKDDGAGKWENWDYVYRNLGNRKESSRDLPISAAPAPEDYLSEPLRGMSLARSNTPPRRSDAKTRTEGDGASRNRLSKNSIELEDAVPKHRLSKASLESEIDVAKNRRSKHVVENDYKVSKALISSSNDFVNNHEEELKISGSKQLNEGGLTQLVSGDEGVRTLRRSPDSPKSYVVTPDVARSTRSSPDPPRPNVVTLDVSPSFLRDVSPVVQLPPEDKWECVACTYLNAARLNVCEMCGKSRVRGDIKPQPCGGKHCPNCTLVNERGRNFCAACQQSLKDSPTYI